MAYTALPFAALTPALRMRAHLLSLCLATVAAVHGGGNTVEVGLRGRAWRGSPDLVESYPYPELELSELMDR